MKITIYELLGLIKDGKAPKKIKYCGCIYEWEEDWYLTKEKNCKVCLGGKKEDINQLYNAFNDNVEIIEEVKDKEYEDIEEYLYVPQEFLTDGSGGSKPNKNSCEYKINQLIRNQKYILERVNKNE